MSKVPVDKIRNIVVVGHAKSGKTTLVDAILHLTKVNDRLGLVDQGNSASDFNKDEIARQTTIWAKSFHCPFNDHMIFLTDTPGADDFVGDVYSTMRATDSALFAIDAIQGIGIGTRRSWKHAEEAGLTRFITISRLDKEHADFYECLEKIRNVWGQGVIPLSLPIGSQADIKGVYSLLDFDSAPPAEIADQVTEWREALMEAVAESDDAMMEKYFEEGTLTPEEIKTGLEASIKSGRCTPVFATAALQELGISEILNDLILLSPSPAARGGFELVKGGRIEPDPAAPFTGFVYKTVVDDFVGQLTMIRVLSGTIKGDSEFYNFTQGSKERVGALLSPQGKTPEKVESAGPGEIVAIAKLKSTKVNDTIGDAGQERIVAPIVFPNPNISFAVYSTRQGDEEKISTGLSRMADEDPTLRVARHDETRELLISGMGDVHIDVMVTRLKEKSGVEIELRTPLVPYKETITVSSEGHYRHKKQSGGHGQFGEVYCRLEPKPRGEGFEFADEIFGGSIPRNYVPAVEKGVMEALEKGAVAGYPVVDVKVVVYDGSYHAVDSSEMAFKIAGRGAFRDAMEKAKPGLLEPIMTVAVTVPDEFMGDITGDLNSKRGRIQGMEPQEGLQVIRAQVPMAEMFRYATELRSITGGRGSFEMTFSHYEEVPGNVVQKIAAEAKAREEAEA